MARLFVHWPRLVEALVRFIKPRARRLALAFAGVALPLALFAELADEVREAEAFAFDEPLLRLAHDAGSPGMDAVMRLASDLGFAWGVIPADVAVFTALVLLGHVRRGLFFGLAVGGSALLNMAGKAVFARERPDLWLSIAPEHTFSFPSGHAMGSATLAAATVLLVWHTAWRWPAALLAAGFVLWVGASRIYLGVHFPSDILAGWAAAVGWACLVYLIVRPNRGGPHDRTPGMDARGGVVPESGLHHPPRTAMRHNARCLAAALLLCGFMLSSVAFADASVKTRLDARGLKYEVDDDGDYKVTYSYKSEGRTQLVFVSGKTESVAGIKVREVFAPAAKDGINGAKALKLMGESRSNKLGSWELQGEVLYFVIKLPDSVNATELESAMDVAAQTADNMEIELSGDRDAL